MEKNQIPKVSVIVPTFNRASYLKLTLESIAAQTFKDFEVIVVDDGSPNNEAEVVCRPFDFCRYFKIENSGGPAKPRNTGIDMARGKYLAFVDDDDLWMPEKLTLQVEILDNFPDFGLVHGYCTVIDSQGNKTGKTVGRLKNPFLKHGYVFDRMVGKFTVMMPTPLIRKEVIEQSGGFNEKIPSAGEDSEFFVRLAFYTPFYFLDRPLVFYRVHSNGISQKNYNYNHLPVVLYRTVTSLKQKEGMEGQRFRSVVYSLLLQQVGMANCSRTFRTAFVNLFKISIFFWLKPVVVWGLVLRLPKIIKFK